VSGQRNLSAASGYIESPLIGLASRLGELDARQACSSPGQGQWRRCLLAGPPTGTVTIGAKSPPVSINYPAQSVGRPTRTD